MVEGLWSIEFASSHGFVGGGVVVLETQRIFGGDSSYYYIGDYRVQNNQIVAMVTITHYNGPPSSIFGNRPHFQVRISGQTNPSIMDVHGHLVGDPNQVVAARLTKRAELP